MKTYIYLLLLCVLFCNNSLSAQKTFTDLLFYDVDAFEIESNQTLVLDSLVDRYYSYHDYSINIIGHADNQGTDDYNQKIASKRAQHVELYLLSKGIPQSKITIDSEGESRPLTKAELNIPNASDRRVEIVSRATVFASVDDLLDKLGPQLQTFHIDNSIDQTITMINGSEIFIPAFSLVYADGSGAINGKATIEVKESFDVVDFVAENLHTTTEESLLQTGGMIYINASAGGKQLGIKSGNTLDVMYPQKQIDEGMSHYSAIESPVGTSWKSSGGEVNLLSQVKSNEYDLSLLLDLDIPTPVKPTIGFDSRMPKIPVIPTKPTKPPKPAIPSKEAIKKKSKDEEESDELYAKSMEKYTKSLKIYNKRLASYEDMKLNYDTVKPRAEEELIRWEQEVGDRLNKVNEYRQKMQDYYCDTKLANALNYLHSNVGTLPSEELYLTFRKMVYTDIEIEGILNPYDVAFGNFKKQVLRRKKVSENTDYNAYGRKSKFAKVIQSVIKQIDENHVIQSIPSDNSLDTDQLDRYMFSVGNFGYHNVDKPLELLPEEMMEVVISDKDDGTRYYIVLKDAQSVISPILANGGYSMDKLPKNHDLKIIGVKLVDSMPQIAVTDINTGSDAQFAVNMEFKSADMGMIKKELESLNAYAGI